MASNYDSYHQNVRGNNKNYYPKKYNNPKELKKNPQQSIVREVEINSLTQTEPSKTKKMTIINENSEEATIDQADVISKTNDETPNLTYLKHCFTDLEEPHYKDNINDQLRTILGRLEEVDIDKKISDIILLLNQKCEKIKNETKEEIAQIKESMHQRIIESNKTNGKHHLLLTNVMMVEKDIKEIKSLLSWECLNQLRQSLTVLKGESYSKPKLITSVYLFERYYDSIMSQDLREKYASGMSVKEIINSIDTCNDQGSPVPLDQKFWMIVKNIKGKITSKLNLSLSGSVYRIVKHFSGLPDEIVIEFGDLQPILNAKTISKAKKKISLVINLIYEILIKQIKSSKSANKIFAYGHIYYGNLQDKTIDLKESAEGDIYYDYIHL